MKKSKLLKMIKKIFLMPLLALALCSALLCGCGESDDYVLTIDGNKISSGEFMVYLMEQKKSFEQQGGEDIWEADFDGVSAEEVAKQNAMNSVLMVKTAVKQAKELNIDSGANDAAGSESSVLYAEMNDWLGSERLHRLNVDEKLVSRIINEGHTQQRLFDYITEGYRVSETDFEKYLNDYYAGNKAEYSTVTVKQIFLPADADESSVNEQKTAQLFADIQNGKDFDDAAGGSAQETSLDLSLFGEDTLNKIFSTPIGGVCAAEETDGYYIFKILDIQTVPIDDIRDDVKANYIRSKKQEIYQAQNDKWISETDYAKNDAVWNSITVK